MSANKNITFSPIFDQSVGSVWFNFLRIETLCNLKYGYKVDTEAKIDIYNRNVQEWKKQKYTFAFGAYNGDKMVGFASGYREDKQEMYLHNLYVMPEYKGKGIGKALLEQCELNATLITDKLTLISLDGSLGFYKKCGYAIRDERNCEKKLPEEIMGGVPVFKSVSWFRNVNINLGINIAELEKYKNVPMFAYVSLNRQIDAVAFRTLAGEDKIYINPKKSGMKYFYERKLLSALAKVR